MCDGGDGFCFALMNQVLNATLDQIKLTCWLLIVAYCCDRQGNDLVSNQQLSLEMVLRIDGFQ